MIFILSFLLLLCLIAKEINTRTDIPYSTLILIIGFFLSLVSKDNLIGQGLEQVQKIGNKELFYIFIPLLIYEQGFNSDIFLFKRNLKSILLLAFPGVLFCAVLYALTLSSLGFSAIPFSGLLVICSILGSTDPIAVSSLLKELGAPHKLNMLLEGESLLNDGVSVVLYESFLKIYNNEEVTLFSLSLDTITLCIGGPIIGSLIGLIFYYWMNYSMKNGVLVVCITFINAFLVFFLCEYLSWNVSGILAIVLSSIIISYKGKFLVIEDNISEVLENVWKFVQFVTESILFIVTGIFIGSEGQKLIQTIHWTILLPDMGKIVIFYFLQNFCRFIVVLLFFPCMNDEKKKYEYKINIKDCAMIAYSGIRGAFPLIMCLGLVKNDHYDLYFRQTTVLVTIETIFMGMIFNGLTMKFLAKKLQIIKPNQKIQEIKQILQKELFLQSYRRFKSMKYVTELASANWSLVYDISGLHDEFKILSNYSQVEQMKKKKTEAEELLPKEENMDAEYRMRIIYSIKSLIIQHLKEAHCSKSAAMILIEVSNCALEDCEQKLSLWYHMEELFEDDPLIQFLEQSRKINFLHHIIKQMYQSNLCNLYEAVYHFIDYLEIIKNNSDYHFSNLSKNKSIITEINRNQEKGKELLKKLTKEDSSLIQLFQTKKAAREILYTQKKSISRLEMNGILTEEEIKLLMKKNFDQRSKIENFGIKVNKFYFKDILNSMFLFSELNEDEIEKLTNQEIIHLKKDEILFKEGEKSKGIFILIEGLVTASTKEVKKLRAQGSVIGIGSLLDKNYDYDNTVKADSHCSLLKIPLDILQGLITKYSDFEKNLFYTYYLHKILLLSNYEDLVEIEYLMNKDFFYIEHGKKNDTKFLNTSLFLVRGEIEIVDQMDPNMKDFYDTWHFELNLEKKPLKIVFLETSLLILFSDNQQEVNQNRPTMMIQKSVQIYKDAEKIHKEFDEITRMSKIKG